MKFFENIYEQNAVVELTKQQFEQRLNSFEREISVGSIQDVHGYFCHDVNRDAVKNSDLILDFPMSTVVFHLDSEADLFIVQ